MILNPGLQRALLFLAALTAATANGQDRPVRDLPRDIAEAGGAEAAAEVAAMDGGAGIPEMEGDDEFGELIVIERASNWYPFVLRAALNAFRTNNAELASSDGISDTYLRGNVSLNYNPAIRGNLFADIGVYEETYRYDNLSALDFDYLRSHAGVYYYLPSGEVPLEWLIGNGFLFANYAWYRVSDGLFGPGVFSNHSAVLGFQRAVPVLKGHQFYYGLSSDLSFDASDGEFQRHEHRAYAGYTVEWTEDLLTRAHYTASWFDYLESGQGDWNHVFELIAYQVLARPVFFGLEGELYLEASASFTLNDSNVIDQDYEYFNWGGGVGYRTSF